MDKNIEELLECLIDEVRANGDPSERTIMVLAKYENEYDCVQKYFANAED